MSVLCPTNSYVEYPPKREGYLGGQPHTRADCAPYNWKPTLNPVVQRDGNAIFGAAIVIYTSQQNMKGVVNDALNDAMPKA